MSNGHPKRAMRGRGAVIVMVALVGIVLGLVVLAVGGGAVYRVAGEPTPLMRAARAGAVTEVQRLLADGADIDERRGYSLRAGLFLAHGPGLAIYRDTALLSAIEAHDAEVVRLLLDAGADATVEDSLGRGLWDYAVSGGVDPDVFLLLAERFGVPPRYIDRALPSVIDDDRLLEFLLSSPSSTTARESALCNFAARGDFARMDRVLETLTVVPTGALVCAVGGRRPVRPTVEHLLARGADPNGDGRSIQPLSAALLSMTAGTAGQSVPDEVQALLELLLGAGADPRFAAGGFSSPIDLARLHGHESAAVFLEGWPPRGEADPR
jgi:hypothetical protein